MDLWCFVTLLSLSTVLQYILHGIAESTSLWCVLFLQKADPEVLEMAIQHAFHEHVEFKGTCHECGITESQASEARKYWNIFFRGDASDCSMGTAILQVAALHLGKCKATNCLIA